MQMIQPFTQGAVLWPSLQDTKSGFPLWIHSFSEQQKKLAIVSVPDVSYQSSPLGIYGMK